MKKIFLGLTAATILYAIYNVIIDIRDGVFDGLTIVGLLFLLLVAGVFGFLAWLFDGKSPVKRTAEQAKNVVKQEQEKFDAYVSYSPAIKRRIWKFRIIGLVLVALAVWLCIAGNWDTIPVSIATVILIIGIAVFNMGSPADYNAMTDGGAMIAMDVPRKIEEFYRAFQNEKTPLGSAYLGKFSTSPYTSLIFGPNVRGEFLYFYLNRDGMIGYVGYSMLDSTISERLTEPRFPAEADAGEDLAGHLVYHSDVFLMREWLQKSLEHFVKTGTILPFREISPSQIYTFSEDFKLTGQHFTVQDTDGNTLYTVDGTAPLVKLRVLDNYDREVFTMTKQLGHALATYKFYQDGELYGTLEKQFDLVRDRFTMEVTEGKLELREYSGTVGHNYKVTLNGEILGAIMDDMDLTVENAVFDNAYLIVYRPDKLPLLVGAACHRAQRKLADLSVPVKHLKFRHGGLALGADLPQKAGKGQAGNGGIDYAGIRVGAAEGESVVGFLHRRVLEKGVKMGVLCQQDDAKGVPVQPGHGMKGGFLTASAVVTGHEIGKGSLIRRPGGMNQHTGGLIHHQYALVLVKNRQFAILGGVFRLRLV